MPRTPRPKEGIGFRKKRAQLRRMVAEPLTGQSPSRGFAELLRPELLPDGLIRKIARHHQRSLLGSTSWDAVCDHWSSDCNLDGVERDLPGVGFHPETPN